MSARGRRAEAIRGALLGTFVGDALGMPFEGALPGTIPERVEMSEARLGRGTYTDDTQMMIALAESLIDRDAIDDDHLARAFLAAYDPRRGYGRGTREVFELWRAGVPVAEAAGRLFGGSGSMGNGAAMRISPVAARFADHPARLRDEAERSARLTHRHPVGVDAAVVQATAIAAAIRGEDVLAAADGATRTPELTAALQCLATLQQERPEPGELAASLGTSSAAHESVPAAIHAAAAHDSFEGAVVFAVRCGGDTDTIAAMAGAISGARFGADAIPQRWMDVLEDNERGRSHVEELAERLAARAAA